MASDDEKGLDLGPIKEFVIELDNKHYWDDYVLRSEVMDNMCDLIREVEKLRGEVDSLKREVNEYEGKDWRSDGPVYPEVEDKE